MRKIRCILLLVLLFALFTLSSCVPPAAMEDEYSAAPAQEEPPAEIAEEPKPGKGKLVFLVTDLAKGIEELSKVEALFGAVEAYSEESKVWITIADSDQMHDLLALGKTGKHSSLGEADVDAGKYSEIRVNLKKVNAIMANGSVNIPMLPGNEIRTKIDLVVEKNKTTAVILDFLLDRSFHVTGAGKFVMAPVLAIESKSGAEIEVSGETAEIREGTQIGYSEFGMDVDGTMKKGFVIDPDADLRIKNNAVEYGVEKEPAPEQGSSCESLCEADCSNQMAVCKSDCNGWAERACKQDTKVECIFYCPVGVDSEECGEVCGLGKGECKTEYRKRCTIRCEERKPRCTERCIEKECT